MSKSRAHVIWMRWMTGSSIMDVALRLHFLLLGLRVQEINREMRSLFTAYIPFTVTDRFAESWRGSLQKLDFPHAPNDDWEGGFIERPVCMNGTDGKEMIHHRKKKELSEIAVLLSGVREIHEYFHIFLYFKAVIIKWFRWCWFIKKRT